LTSTDSSVVKVPHTLDEALDPDWLTAALGRRFPGIKVVAARLGPVVSRVSTNARFEIECEGGQPPDLPRHLCVKGYFSEQVGVLRSAGEPEVLFYRDLADPIGVRTLKCVYADIDPETRHGVVITHDVAICGATFLDALSPYTVEQAEASLDLYASLHGRTWGRTLDVEGEWLAPRIAGTLRARGLKEIKGNFGGPIGAGVPQAARDAERLLAAITGLAQMAPVEPSSILHGDAHIGNVFLDRSGAAWLVDWQLVQRGPWYLDAGYHIGCVLPVADRRRHEERLLTHYLERLAAAGGEPPTLGDAHAGMCAGLVYGFFLWAITLKVHPSITTAMLARLGTAVADHDALAVTERLTGIQ
jgi:hypothetical protein